MYETSSTCYVLHSEEFCAEETAAQSELRQRSFELAANYLPLIRATARKYQGDYGKRIYDDLVQEGWLAIVQLIQSGKYKTPEEFRKRISLDLSSKIRSIAFQMLNDRYIVSLDETDETGNLLYDTKDETNEFELRMTELKLSMKQYLSKKQHKIAILLTEGYSQKQIAEKFVISQPAISKEIMKIRKQLSEFKEEYLECSIKK